MIDDSVSPTIILCKTSCSVKNVAFDIILLNFRYFSWISWGVLTPNSGHSTTNGPLFFVQAPEAPSPEPEISELNFKAVGSTDREVDEEKWETER